MIRGVGIDIVEVARVARVADRHGERFLRRVYTPLEIAKAHGNRQQYLASRFSAKEAVFKALGTGWGGGVRWTDVEVDNLPSGQPVMRLEGAARTRADRLGVERIYLTISHTADYATAQVVLEGSGPSSEGPVSAPASAAAP